MNIFGCSQHRHSIRIAITITWNYDVCLPNCLLWNYLIYWNVSDENLFTFVWTVFDFFFDRFLVAFLWVVWRKKKPTEYRVALSNFDCKHMISMNSSFWWMKNNKIWINYAEINENTIRSGVVLYKAGATSIEIDSPNILLNIINWQRYCS